MKNNRNFIRARGHIRLISAKVTMMTDDLISQELLTRRTTGRPRSEKMSVVNGCLVLRNNERKNVKKKEVSRIARGEEYSGDSTV